MSLDEVDSERCESLARRAAQGEDAAARTLVAELWPTIGRLVRAQRSLGPLARNEDHVHDVVAKVVEKMCARDGRALMLYVSWRERHADKDFHDWLRIVIKNVSRDHVRAELGDVRDRQPGEPSPKRLLNELAASPNWEHVGLRPPVTMAQTARQMMEFAQTKLTPLQLQALAAWIEGASFEDVASELALRELDDARNLVRAAVAILRRHFVPSDA